MQKLATKLQINFRNGMVSFKNYAVSFKCYTVSIKSVMVSFKSDQDLKFIDIHCRN